MRCLLLGACTLHVAVALPLQAAPARLTHHGVLTQGGSPVSGNVEMEFRLYDVPGALAPFWSEAMTVTASDGYYSVLLGGSAPLEASDLAAASDPELGITVGAAAEMTPRLKVSAVPYALVAKQAALAADLDCAACVAATEVAFAYAGSATPGGPASDLDCSGLCVSTAELDNAAVTTPKLSDNAVTTPKLLDAAVTTPKLADANVTRPKLAACDSANQIMKWSGSAWGCATDENTTYSAGTGLSLVGTQFSINQTTTDGWYVNEGQADSITSAMITDGAVATVDLADAAVSTAKIANDAVTPDKLSHACASGQLLVSNGSGWTCTASGKVLSAHFAITAATSQTVASTTPVVITGLSITLTPKTAGSRFLITAVINGAMRYVSSTLIYRNGSKVRTHTGNNNEAGSQATTYPGGDTNSQMLQQVINYLDSPNTTAAVTYDVRYTSGWSGGTYTTYVNDRGEGDMRTPSTLSILEIGPN